MAAASLLISLRQAACLVYRSMRLVFLKEARMSNVVNLTDEEAREALRLARHFALYGAPHSALSNVESNYLGVIGEYAVSKKLFGSTRPVFEHRRRSLDRAIVTNKVEDGGTDIPGYRINVKTAYDQYGLGAPDLHLLVPPWQVDRETCYIHCVVEPPESGNLLDARSVIVWGFAESSMLAPAERGAFLGWPCCVGSECLPMSVFNVEDYAVSGVVV